MWNNITFNLIPPVCRIVFFSYSMTAPNFEMRFCRLPLSPTVVSRLHNRSTYRIREAVSYSRRTLAARRWRPKSESFFAPNDPLSANKDKTIKSLNSITRIVDEKTIQNPSLESVRVFNCCVKLTITCKGSCRVLCKRRNLYIFTEKKTWLS